MTTSLIETLHKFPQVGDVWRVNSGSPVRNMRGAPKGTADVCGYLVGGARFFGVELKNDHADACICAHCEAQRVWGARVRIAGGLYVKARSEHAALVGLGLVSAKETA